MNKKRTILLTNDDGYPAEGLHALYNALCERHSVTVVAPEHEQSGAGHAFTYTKSLHCREIAQEENLRGYVISGTPSDCIKLALAKLLDKKPDVVVSGINVGENSGMAGHYSGTLAAAREGAFWHVLSLAFSICDTARQHMAAYARAAEAIIESVIDLHNNAMSGVDGKVFFNINFPSCEPGRCKGIKVTRQSLAFFNDRYKTIREDASGLELKLYGEKKPLEESEEYDSRALQNGYIAVTPLHFDATAQDAIGRLGILEKACWH
jgi:5'-nucleotidase